MDVLEDMSQGQINLASEAARELITNTIMAAIKTNNNRKGWVLDLSTLDGGPKLDTPIYEKSVEQKARETWVCSICGENTFEVDYDYIGSGTNHLGCELKVEMSSSNDDLDYYSGPDGSYEFEKQDHREYPYNSFVRNKEERARLSEQVVDNKNEGYIYESSDGGKTVYKREVGSDKKELVWSSDEKRKFNG